MYKVSFFIVKKQAIKTTCMVINPPSRIVTAIGLSSQELFPLDFSSQVDRVGPVRAHVDRKYVMLTENVS